MYLQALRVCSAGKHSEGAKEAKQLMAEFIRADLSLPLMFFQSFHSSLPLLSPSKSSTV